MIERGLPAATAAGLKARGHHVALAPSPWGGAQAIRIDWRRGVLIGGSDPRKDGCAHRTDSAARRAALERFPDSLFSYQGPVPWRRPARRGR